MQHASAQSLTRERSALSRLRIALLVLGFWGCAGGPPAPAAPAPTAAGGGPAASAPARAAAAATAPAVLAPPKEIHWFRSSAEYRALARQTYRMAEQRVREQATGRPRGSWAVILDADETVVDNSEYQRRLAERGDVYATATWNAWVRERGAGAVPGAREFLAAVSSLGGRVVIVTNRDEEVCNDTRANMQTLGLAFDLVMCRVGGVSDKNPRYAAVANGSAAPGVLPSLEVLLWVGDNIQDFPSLSQAVREQGDGAYDPFGRSYIMLPNPMYGSWEANTPR